MGGGGAGEGTGGARVSEFFLFRIKISNKIKKKLGWGGLWEAGLEKIEFFTMNVNSRYFWGEEGAGEGARVFEFCVGGGGKGDG